MWAIDSPRARALIAAVWLPFAIANATLMWIFPGQETVPYHLIWASFAFLYGVTVWSATVTWTVFSTITVITGFEIIRDVRVKTVEIQECSEIALMALIVAVLIWHVNRDRAARRQLAETLEAERIRANTRELTTRFGSHELRTRLTIARGFMELVRDSAADRQLRDDAAVAVLEVDKATSLSENLMRLVRFDSSLELESLDIDELIRTVMRRWSARVERHWEVSTTAGMARGNGERIEAAVDCLVENAVKFTTEQDVIAVDAHCAGGQLFISVRDSGVGIPAHELPRVTDPFRTGATAGARAGHGLGLAIVRAATEARGGSLSIDSAPGRGTTVVIRISNADVATDAATLRAAAAAPAGPVPAAARMASTGPVPAPDTHPSAVTGEA